MTRRTVAIVTGTRAEFGLLRPVIDAVRKHKHLKLQLIAAGAHFLPPARTIREVRAAYPVAAEVRMQKPGRTGRAADAEALGRGVAGFARAFAKLKPDWVVVLGDRIEAFAAASAASIAGIAVCHIHGGDRAEGIADEAMRHAITKLSHLHCAATKLSGERIVKLGERPEYVHVTGSPAIDGLRSVRPMSDAEARRYGDPRGIVLLHPSGLRSGKEYELAADVAIAARELCIPGRAFDRGSVFSRILLLSPNHDPGRDEIVSCWEYFCGVGAHMESHLPRARFLSLLARMRRIGGCLVGNSSAGLIEAAAIGVPVLNFGPRQSGRERGRNVVDVPEVAWPDVALALQRCRRLMSRGITPSHPYGDGRAGPRIAALLAKVDPHDPALLRKRNTY